MPNESGTLDSVGETIGPLIMLSWTPGEFNKIDVTLDGDLTGTVELQASFDGGSTWLTIKEYAAAVYEVVDAIELGMQFQLEVTAASAGSYEARIGYGQAFP